MKAYKYLKFNLFFILSVLLLVGCTNTDGNKTQTVVAGPDTSQPITDIVKQDPVKPRSYIIEIKNMEFVPAELEVHSGDTVLWINKDLVVHDITQENKAWASGPLPSDSSYKKVITNSDAYYCSIHVIMRGNLTVKQ